MKAIRYITSFCAAAIMLAGCGNTAEQDIKTYDSISSTVSETEETSSSDVIDTNESSMIEESSIPDESVITEDLSSAWEITESAVTDDSDADRFKAIFRLMITKLNEEAENEPGILDPDEGIILTDTDGGGMTYTFEYGDETYYAIYSPDNWKIVDSYKITSKADMLVICQALTDIYPLHGSDMTSYRVPEDMAYEWIQHNIAYTLLPDGDRWKENAKDVDLNPSDQNKNIFEMYKAKTGKDLI